jgi:hypothetical protein
VREHWLPSANRAQPVALLATLDHADGPLHVMSSCVEWEPEFADDHLAQTRALAGLLLDPGLDGPCPFCSPLTSTPRRTAPKCVRSPTS